MAIGELGRVVTGKTPRTSVADNFDGSYPFITIPDLNQGPYVTRSARTLSDKGLDAVRTSLLPAGAVLMSCIATVGRCGITTVPSVTNQQINAVIPNEGVSALFMYYLFSQLGPSLSSAGGGGSVYTNVSKGRFSEIKIRLPKSLREQERIADVLVLLDRRIKALKVANVILESIAQNLFNSWFVDFDPVRAKAEGREPETMDAATAALFPDEFEDSDLGAIPKGWRVDQISALAKLSGGKQLKREFFAPGGRSPVFGGAGEMGRTDLSNAEGIVITVGRVGAYCGQFFWHLGEAWINNNASRVAARGDFDFWLYWCLRHVDMEKIKKGAAQPFVSNSDISALSVVRPPDKLMHAFQQLAFALHRRMDLHLKQADSLIALRDTLLPRLISGKLRLPDVERDIEAATA